MSGRRILIVDDDEALRASLCEQLQLRGEFITVSAASGAAALKVAEGQDFDAVIMDVGLPDIGGHEACRLMRCRGVKAPILMLTRQVTDSDQALILNAGANDYVAKPFRLNVLLARLRAQLRRHERSDDATFTIGPYSFRPGAKLLLREGDGKKVQLTEKETAILTYLHRAGDKVVARDTLLNEVWGYNPNMTTHTLETHVYRLRQKIEGDPSRAKILVTEPGGYKLVP